MDFLASNEPGIVSSFSKNTLVNAAESLFTANGLFCPVKIVEAKGQAYILNREMVV